MLPTLPILLAFLLAGSGQPAPDAPVEPADAALVDRFMAVIPQEVSNDSLIATDDGELARLAELNPGREDELRRLLDAEAACARGVQAEITRTSLRGTARGLGSERLARLITFFESEDFRRFTAISDRTNGGADATEAERAEAEQIMSRYPVAEFQQAMIANIGTMMGGMEKFMICRTRRESQLEQLGLRSYPEAE